MAFTVKKIVNKNYPFDTPGARLFPKRVVILLLSACSVFSTQAVGEPTESFGGDGGSLGKAGEEDDGLVGEAGALTRWNNAFLLMNDEGYNGSLG